MAGSGEERFLRPPGGRAEVGPAPGDPVSWLQIEQGWSVTAADGAAVGTVAQVAGDKGADIFAGLAVETAGDGSRIVDVPAEQVGAITVGAVTLKLTAAQAAALGPYAEAPPQEQLRPRPPSAADRISGWLRRR